MIPKGAITILAMVLMTGGYVGCAWSEGLREVFDGFCIAMVSTATGYSITRSAAEVGTAARKKKPQTVNVKVDPGPSGQ